MTRSKSRTGFKAIQNAPKVRAEAKVMPIDVVSGPGLTIYTVSRAVIRREESYIVWRQLVKIDGEVHVERNPVIVARGLDAARAVIPNSKMRVGRLPFDDPDFVEKWF